MLKECATITAIDADGLTLTSARTRSCAQCEQGLGCGGGIIAKLAPRRAATMQMPISNAGTWRLGQVVELALSEQAVLMLSAYFYLVPLGGLVFGALIGSLVAHDLAALYGATIGLLLAVGGVRLSAERLRERYLQPTITLSPKSP